MRRHKRFRYGPPLFRPRLGGFIWLIILASIFFGQRWWPGILILIGIAVLFGSLFREERPPEMPPQTPPPFAPPPPAPRPAQPPVDNSFHRADLLPTTCPNCGGPVRSYEVKWTGPQTAACAYCGSNLKAKK